MRDAEVIRLIARADLDTSEEGARDAWERVQNGDVDYQWLLDEWHTGRLLLGRLHVAAFAAGADGRLEEVGAINHGVWLERDVAPSVESQVAEAAPKDFPDLAAKLREQGLNVARADLEGMYIHVELADRLLQELGSNGERTVDLGTRARAREAARGLDGPQDEAASELEIVSSDAKDASQSAD